MHEVEHFYHSYCIKEKDATSKKLHKLLTKNQYLEALYKEKSFFFSFLFCFFFSKKRV